MNEKTSYLLDKKMWRKNQIPKYHASSSKKYDKDWYMSNQLIKNLLTQWNTEKENQKIYEIWLGINFLSYK